MALDTKLVGSSSGNGVEVNASNQMKITAETDAVANPGNVGSVRTFSEVDSGDVTGTATLLSPEASDDYRLRVGVDQTMFNMAFEGTIIARDRFTETDATAVCAQANGFLTVNSAGATASGNGCDIRTKRTFPFFGAYPLYCEMWAKDQNGDATNSLTEFGLGYCSGVTAQLTDGIYFRRLAGGQLRLVATYNSTDVAYADITITNIPPRDDVGSFAFTEVNHYVIAVHNDVARAWINDALVAVIPNVSTTPGPTSANAQPWFARVYNTGVASAGRSISFGFINISTGDQSTNRDWSHVLCSMGQNAVNIQPGTTSGGTLSRGASTLGWPTSGTASTAGTWTATSAPALNSLGGMWTSPAISTLTTDADYPVFSYLNPAGTSTLPGKNLYITGCRVSEIVARAAASTNTIFIYCALGIGSTSSATTATEGIAIVAARIIPVGVTFWPAAAAVGDSKGGWTLDFSQAPLFAPPGTYVQFIVRPSGTVTSNTLTLQGLVTFMGYFE